MMHILFSSMRIRFLLFVSFVSSVVATLAFFNNVAVVVEWWLSFLAARGNSSEMKEISGIIPWLDWAAVDHSCVTTFIPMIGFWCMTSGLFKIVKGRRVKPGNFPFFKGSDQFNVALGLFGTLWGIIVIGYFDLATVTMADLMQCLHTALFSTLAAVVWVFLIDHPVIRPFFLRMLENSKLAQADNDDLAAAVDELVVKLKEASSEFAQRQKEFETAFECRQRVYEEHFGNRQREYEKNFENRLSVYEGKLLDRLNKYESAAARREHAYESSFEKRLKSSEEAFLARYETYEAAFEKRLAEYSADFDLRQKEYNEFFRRRIEELEKRFLGEKARADEVTARLSAVASALNK